MSDPLQQLIEGIRQAQPPARDVPLLKSRRVQLTLIACGVILVVEMARGYGLPVGQGAVDRVWASIMALAGLDAVRNLGKREPPAPKDGPAVELEPWTEGT